MVISSVDNGITWFEPLDITSQITKANWKDDFMFITSGKGIQTKDGLLLHCLVNLNKERMCLEVKILVKHGF